MHAVRHRFTVSLEKEKSGRASQSGAVSSIGSRKRMVSRYYSLACGKMPADGLSDPGENLPSAKKTGHSMRQL